MFTHVQFSDRRAIAKHPQGDRSHEQKLGQVIEAWQVLKVAKAFE